MGRGRLGEAADDDCAFFLPRLLEKTTRICLKQDD